MNEKSPFSNKGQTEQNNIGNKENQPKKKVLLADDDESVLAASTMVLEMLNFEVVEVKNAQELLEKLESGEHFDLLVTDNSMPGMTGIEAIEKIRQDERYDNLPILLNSGDTEGALGIKAKELNAAFLAKPYDIDTFEQVVAQLTEQKED